jgi:hypothetical protein
MVEMVVGDKDGLERVQAVSPIGKNLFEATQADTGVYDDSEPPVMKEIAVAAAPA